ncbi:MAG: M10 family metallopeptidase [Piscinibacter sp.]
MASPTSETPWTFSDLTGVRNIDALLGGTQWVSKALTFSSPGASASWSTAVNGGYGPSNGSGEPWSAEYHPLTESDILATRDALAAWQAVSGLTFTETADNETTVGDLRFAYTWGAEMDGAQAYAYFPGTGPIAGDVWFNTRSSSATDPWSKGTFEYVTVVHEIGHALGLKHPFDPSGLSSTLLPSSLDSRSFTVMSYSADPGNINSAFSYEPTTPMVLDIQALQTLYGKNTSTNAGNTNYLFKSGTDYHQTIWDAGGTDTITYQSNSGGEIDLNAGVSGGSRLGNALYVFGGGGQILYEQYNVWIAYGSIIENAVGGNGNDTIIGSSYANNLYGGQGNDSIVGGGGADTLNGSTGNDTMQGGAGSDTFYVNSSGDRISDTSTAAADLDTVVSAVNWSLATGFERLTLSGSAATTGTGNSAANLLTGNSGANRLTGGGGNDTLNGGAGNDTLDGGAGSDRYDVDAAGDVVADSGTAAGDRDSVFASITWTLGSTLENLTLTGASSIRGTGNTLGNALTGNGAANLLSGAAGNDTLVGGAGNDTLYGGAGIDRVTGGSGADVVVLDNRSNSDIVLDFVSGTDDLRLRMGTLSIGDGDLIVEGAATRTAAGGFSSSAELVIFSTDVAALSTANAAAAIGSASSAYAVGRTALFVVDTGASSGVYLFTAADANSTVSASELTLLATLSGTSATGVGDYVFSS